MAEITFERGRELTYPRVYPKLTFTPIFGRNGDFIWVEEVRGAWPEHDSEFVFVRSAVHDQRVDRLKEENEKLRELARGMYGILATFDVILGNHDACETPRPLIFGENKSFKSVMCELGIEEVRDE